MTQERTAAPPCGSASRTAAFDPKQPKGDVIRSIDASMPWGGGMKFHRLTPWLTLLAKLGVSAGPPGDRRAAELYRNAVRGERMSGTVAPGMTAFYLGYLISLPCLTHAAPITISGTTDSTPSSQSIFKLSLGDSFKAVVNLSLSRAVGKAHSLPGFSVSGMQYSGIAGSIEVTIGGVSWSFAPDAIVIGNDLVDGKVYRQPADLSLLQAAGPDGLLLIIEMLQRDGSAIDKLDLFIPETTDSFGSAHWALYAPSFDPHTGHQLPRLDDIADGPIEGWAASSTALKSAQTAGP